MTQRTSVNYIAAALLLICAIGNTSMAEAARSGKSCRPYARTPIITIAKGSLRIDKSNAKSQAQLNVKNNDGATFGSSKTLGLTSLRYGVQTSYEITFMDLPGGQQCQWFRRVNVTIDADQTVFIAKEFTNDLCMKNEINSHEMKHVTINRKFIGDMNLVLKREIQKYVKKNTPKKSSPISQKFMVTKKLGDGLLQHINGIKQHHLVLNRKKQQLVDTPEEYRRASHICD